MNKKDRLILVVSSGTKLIKLVITKTPEPVVRESAALLKWHWKKLFDKK